MVVKIKSNKNLNYYQVKIKEKIMKNKADPIEIINMIGLSFVIGSSFCFISVIITNSAWSLFFIPIFILASFLLKFIKNKKSNQGIYNFETQLSIKLLHEINKNNLEQLIKCYSYSDKTYKIFYKIYEKFAQIKNYDEEIFQQSLLSKKNYENYVVFCFVYLMPLIKNTDTIINNYEEKEILEFIESAHKSITSYVKRESIKNLELLQFDKLWYDSYNKKVEERELMDKEKEKDFISDLLK